MAILSGGWEESRGGEGLIRNPAGPHNVCARPGRSKGDLGEIYAASRRFSAEYGGQAVANPGRDPAAAGGNRRLVRTGQDAVGAGGRGSAGALARGLSRRAVGAGGRRGGVHALGLHRRAAVPVDRRLRGGVRAVVRISL